MPASAGSTWRAARATGVQIVPADWVEASVTPDRRASATGREPGLSWTFGYGYKWWIPEDPQGDFLAIGVWGQYIYIDPAREVIIVKTSADPDFDDNDHESVAAFRAIARAVARLARDAERLPDIPMPIDPDNVQAIGSPLFLRTYDHRVTLALSLLLACRDGMGVAGF
jgi:hypothetical protein